MKYRKKLTPALCFEHIKLNQQYAMDDSWAKWYSKIAPLKAERLATTLLEYKDSNSKVLDIGCGTGMTFAGIASTFPKAQALDVFDMEIEAAKGLLKKLGIKAHIGKYDGKHLPFDAHTFDIVTLVEVIEHVEDPDEILREVNRVLKKDGLLYISTANKWWPIEPHFRLPFLSYLPHKLADLYVKFSGRGDSYQNINLPSYSTFKSEVSKYFKVQDITLSSVREYKKFGLAKERGNMIKYIGELLIFVDKAKKIKLLSSIARLVESVFLNASIGWFFMATPIEIHTRKKKNA